MQGGSVARRLQRESQAAERAQAQAARRYARAVARRERLLARARRLLPVSSLTAVGSGTGAVLVDVVLNSDSGGLWVLSAVSAAVAVRAARRLRRPPPEPTPPA
ncbi:MAG: hypothetical protein M3P93_17600, partial [Actinomycetota bacterium]|nr:hypothetical protein [Actinomycetota bacterium]